MNNALAAVEHAFIASTQGKTVMPSKIYLDLPACRGDFRAMPAYVDGMAGLKWVSSYPYNFENDMPSVLATIILCEPKTSYPLAIMDGTYITNMRTGAAGGLAAKYLARQNTSVVGIVGAGKQAETQLLAICKTIPSIELVRLFDVHNDASTIFAEKFNKLLNVGLKVVESIEEVVECDILVTTTPSKSPIIGKNHIRPGTHINAIGADAQGKEELAPEILTTAKIVVDDIEQASHSGEINVPLSRGLITMEHIYSTLGEIAAGIKKGRESEEEITVFDSTGLAIQDIACANYVYQKSKGKACTYFTFFEQQERHEDVIL